MSSFEGMHLRAAARAHMLLTSNSIAQNSLKSLTRVSQEEVICYHQSAPSKMKATIFAFAIGAALVNAQSLPNVPQCSVSASPDAKSSVSTRLEAQANVSPKLNCFVTTLTTDGCSGLTDFACHCQKTDLVSKITPCVQAACSVADQEGEQVTSNSSSIEL